MTRCGISPQNAKMALVLYAGVLGSRKRIQAQLASDGGQDKPFTLSGAYRGSTAMWASLPRGMVLDAFSEHGAYETLYAKAFVVFTYQLWEEFARPKIAAALGVKLDDVRSDLMGEWRHLRNWLVHPDEDTEKAYFRNAQLLAKIEAGLKPGSPEMSADMIFPMMGYLNSLHVVVNPQGASPALEITDMDSATAEQFARKRSEGGFTEVPLWRGKFNPPASK